MQPLSDVWCFFVVSLLSYDVSRVLLCTAYALCFCAWLVFLRCENLADLIWQNRQQIKKVELLRTQLPINVPTGCQDLLPILNTTITGLLSSLVTRFALFFCDDSTKIFDEGRYVSAYNEFAMIWNGMKCWQSAVAVVCEFWNLWWMLIYSSYSVLLHIPEVFWGLLIVQQHLNSLLIFSIKSLF